jgi:hypothetical protein
VAYIGPKEDDPLVLYYDDVEHLRPPRKKEARMFVRILDKEDYNVSGLPRFENI